MSEYNLSETGQLVIDYADGRQKKMKVVEVELPSSSYSKNFKKNINDDVSLFESKTFTPNSLIKTSEIISNQKSDQDLNDSESNLTKKFLTDKKFSDEFDPADFNSKHTREVFNEFSQKIANSKIGKKVASNDGDEQNTSSATLLPNFVTSIFKSIRTHHKLTFYTSVILFFISVSLISIFAYYKIPLIMYSIPVIFFICSTYKILKNFTIFKEAKNEYWRFFHSQENIDWSTQIPMFILKIYKRMHIKNAKANWSMTAIYTIIVTTILLVWGLSYINIGDFRFGDWLVDNLFGSRENMSAFAVIAIYTLVVLFTYHIFTLLYNKHKINSIDSFYGFYIIPKEEIRKDVEEAVKNPKRFFFITISSIFFIFVIIGSLASSSRDRISKKRESLRQKPNIPSERNED